MSSPALELGDLITVRQAAALLVAVVRPEPGGLYTVAISQVGTYGWQACGWECVKWSELRRASRVLIGLADEMREKVENKCSRAKSTSTNQLFSSLEGSTA